MSGCKLETSRSVRHANKRNSSSWRRLNTLTAAAAAAAAIKPLQGHERFVSTESEMSGNLKRAFPQVLKITALSRSQEKKLCIFWADIINLRCA